MSFISGKYEDEFGSINMDNFDMIAVVSCAPDLPNSLIPDKKRWEESTNEYFPTLDIVSEYLEDDMEAIKNMYKVDDDTLKGLIEPYGLYYDENRHGAKKLLCYPGCSSGNEKSLNSLMKEAKTKK